MDALCEEYGLSLLAEIAWQGPEEQNQVLSTLGVEAVVRALRAFPDSTSTPQAKALKCP